MTCSDIEVGWNSDLTIVDDEIIKVTRCSYPAAETAEGVAEGLAYYASELDAQPLRTATLREVGIVEDDDGYHVRHTYDLIDGPSITRMPEEERHTAVAGLLAQVAAMDTIDGPNILRVPFDSKSQNFHVDENGSALTDIFPALTRNADGSFPLEAMGQRRGSVFPWSFGTKGGAMTNILSTAVYRGDTSADKLLHVATTVDDWCYDALPEGLSLMIQNQLRRQIGARFIPYMLRQARHKASTRLGM